MILEELALYADCSLCGGLCCRALHFSKLDGFPRDKPCGVSCGCLCSDRTYNIYHELKQKGMKGCLGYDCPEAGQFAIQESVPANRDMLVVYRKLFSLHQMLWYLGEALLQEETASSHGEPQMLIQTLDTVRRQPRETAFTADIDSLYEQTNRLLKKTIQQKQLRYPSPHKHPVGKRFTNKRLRGMDFSMKSLPAADLSGCDPQGFCFLGSDIRDCRIAGSDLRNRFFLIQMQLNTAIGDSLTRLPNHLHIPARWDTVSQSGWRQEGKSVPDKTFFAPCPVTFPWTCGYLLYTFPSP